MIRRGSFLSIVRGEAGITILQAMIFMGIIAILGGIYAEFNMNQRKEQKRADMKNQYEQLSSAVGHSAGDAGTLRASAEVTD